MARGYDARDAAEPLEGLHEGGPPPPPPHGGTAVTGRRGMVRQELLTSHYGAARRDSYPFPRVARDAAAHDERQEEDRRRGRGRRRGALVPDPVPGRPRPGRPAGPAGLAGRA